jgi:superfamily II DNA/RNA helicase
MNSPQPARSFASLGVPNPIINALAAEGVTAPFPIQAVTMADSLAGKDLLGRGKTGSGKTIAFAIPLVAALAKSGEKARPGSPRGLVLVPTRELANQVAATIAPLAKAMGLRHTVVYGGVGFGNQTGALKAGVDIVVACPGRLEDLMQQGHCRLDRIEVTVLDEADHMADMGFLPGVKRIMDRTPKHGQRLLFSATLDNDVKVLIDRYLSNPVTHALDPADSPVEAMTHHLVETALVEKLGVVTRLAAGADRSLLFTRTKHGAKKLVKQLGQSGIPAVELHGNLSQNARERNLADFSSGQVKVLVATDIAARGIHVDDIRLVVHVDPPAEHKAFLHRSGRTARAGAEGLVVTVVTPDQRKEVRSMTRAAGINPIVTDAVHAGHPILDALAGPAQAPRRITHAQSQPLAERGPLSPRQGQRAGSHRQGSGAGARTGQGARQGQGQGPRSGARTQAATTDAGRPARVTQDGRPAPARPAARPGGRPAAAPSRGRSRRAPAGR